MPRPPSPPVRAPPIPHSGRGEQESSTKDEGQRTKEEKKGERRSAPPVTLLLLSFVFEASGRYPPPRPSPPTPLPTGERGARRGPLPSGEKGEQDGPLAL